MVRKICLDSDVIIEIIHETKKGVGAVDAIENAKIFTTSVNVFELFSRKRDVSEIEKQLSYIDTINFEKDDALEAAKIRKELKGKGKLTGFRDIFIAAITKNTGAELLTFNKKHYENIEGLSMVDV